MSYIRLTSVFILLAVGVIAGNARAQSSVQWYGLVGTYIGTSKHSGSTAAAIQESSGGLTTSYWGIRGAENLGGGYKAIFTLESFFQPTTGAQGRTSSDPYFSRNSFVGLSGPAGTITLGRQTNPTYTNMQLVNPFGASVNFSPIVVQSFVPTFNGVVTGDTVWNNAIEYTSPNFDGLTAIGVYGVGGVAGESGTADIGLHVQYVKGALAAVASAQRVRIPTGTATGEQYAYLAGARYDFTWLKVYAAMETSNAYQSQIGSHTYELGLSIPVTRSGSILAEWARTSRNAPRRENTLRNTGSLAYDYALSRRTDIYAVYMYDKASTAQTANTLVLALRHSF